MKIEKGDLFRVKSTGEILEITGKWSNDEYRVNWYKADGYPDCGIDGQHNTACDIEGWFADGGLEKIKPLRTKRALIRTDNYGKYYGKRFIVDNIKIDDRKGCRQDSLNGKEGPESETIEHTNRGRSARMAEAEGF
jgi:uncharacterized protein YodC (DUF2158 family)